MATVRRQRRGSLWKILEKTLIFDPGTTFFKRVEQTPKLNSESPGHLKIYSQHYFIPGIGYT